MSRKVWYVWQALFTGVPFGIFKLGTGWYLWTWSGFAPLGVALMSWGVLDISLNLASALTLGRVPYCLLAGMGTLLDRWKPRRAWRWSDLGLALDTLLAFTLVAAMLWNRCLPQLAPAFGRSWDLAVVCNILAVGVARVLETLRYKANST